MATEDPNPAWQSQNPAQSTGKGGDAPMALTLTQQFDMAAQSRAIAACRDVDKLQKIAIDLLESWHAQKAATNWAISQQTGWRADGLRDHPADR